MTTLLNIHTWLGRVQKAVIVVLAVRPSHSGELRSTELKFDVVRSAGNSGGWEEMTRSEIVVSLTGSC